MILKTRPIGLCLLFEEKHFKLKKLFVRNKFSVKKSMSFLWTGKIIIFGKRRDMPETSKNKYRKYQFVDKTR